MFSTRLPLLLMRISRQQCSRYDKPNEVLSEDCCRTTGNKLVENCSCVHVEIGTCGVVL